MATKDPVFCIAIHDVAAPTLAAVGTILRALPPGLEGRVAAAVVPCWHDSPPGKAERPLARMLETGFGELLLHGYTHHQTRGGWLGRLTGGADELTGLSLEEGIEQLRRGQAAFEGLTGRPAAGFVPPAWQWGPLTPASLAAHGLRFGVGWWALADAAGYRVPLATFSWDIGPGGPAGYLGELAGALGSLARAEAIPCIVFHPADVGRGFLRRGVRRIVRLLEAGYRPVTFGELLEARSQARATASRPHRDPAEVRRHG